MAQELYRTEYEGEFVVTGVHFKEGKKEQEREWVPNPIDVESISGRATCVSDGISTKHVPLSRLEGHKGGLLGSLALNVYATGPLYKQFKPNFHVTFNPEELAEMMEMKYQEDVVVYTSTRQCLKQPGEFFIIPYGMKSVAEAVAAWLACFDGHNEVYLLGYDEYTEEGERRNKVVSHVNNVIKAFPGVKFYHVIKQGQTPNEWKYNKNLKTLAVEEYISICDIS